MQLQKVAYQHIQKNNISLCQTFASLLEGKPILI